MKAWVRERYGADALELRDVERPEPVDGSVVVRVRAVSVNRGDWYMASGTPVAARAQAGLLKPKSPIVGWDFAGTVESVSAGVTHLAPGDDVYGASIKTFAEYVSAKKAVVRKPANLSFEEAAAVPVAALTALQGLRDRGALEPGQQVLVNGASGGVGTFAVQIAKALGATVTAVCSTRNAAQARSLGADDVVDYTREDFTRNARRYDLLFDVAGNRSWREYKRALAPGGTFVAAGAPKGGRVLGPLPHIAKLWLVGKRSGHRVVFFVANTNNDDLDFLRGLIEDGKVKPVIEQRYDFNELPQALHAMGEGHVRGKLVVTI